MSVMILSRRIGLLCTVVCQDKKNICFDIPGNLPGPVRYVWQMSNHKIGLGRRKKGRIY